MAIRPTTDYENGQMMGMLVVIQLIENAMDNDMGIPETVFTKIKCIATESLSQYLGKPAEDIMLMIDKELESI